MTTLAIDGWRHSVDVRPAESITTLAVRGAGLVMRFLIDADALKHAEQIVGERLRKVMLPADLPVVLDEINGADLEEARRALIKLGSSRFARWLGRRLPNLGALDRTRKDLGPIAAGHLRLALVYLSAVENLLDKAPTPSSAGGADPMAGIYDPNTPTEIAESLLTASRATPTLLAMMYAMDHPSAFSPWLVLDVAERFRDSAHATLRLAVAIIPGADVDLRILPLEDRFDLPTIEARHAEQLKQWQSLPVEHHPEAS